MALDPQVQAVLDQMATLGLPAFNTLSPEQARRQMEMTRAAAPPGDPVHQVEDRTIPGPGGEIPVRIYRPEGDGPLPALVYFHGGGWVIGNIETHDATCRSLTNGAQCVVISVDYRLAPEHKFPAAADDSYAATKWVVDHAAELSIDPARIAVGGDSAGGNLAAVVALMAKEQGGPALVYQALIYPVTDYGYETASYKENAEGYLLSKDSMVWFWDHYLSSPADGKNPHASPLQAKDLNGLPPALVITAGYDPLRDEGAAYAERLKQAGVPVVYTLYPGMIHGFFGMGAVLDKAKEAVGEVCGALRSAFAVRTPA
ncbi:MAG: alpha/beta hydrolase [Dehalococcoidia bacterium]